MVAGVRAVDRGTYGQCLAEVDSGRSVPISVQVRKESGVVVVALDLPYDAPSGVDAERFPLLSAVDPYGDTIFNRLQMSRLMDEVRELMPRATSEQQRMLTALSLACQRCESSVHQYLWFIGD